jgi:hypothetical protein
MVHQSDRDPRPGDDRPAICGPALIPAVFSAPLSGCSRQRGRLVCVPLRHVLPIRVSRFWGASDPITLVKPFVRRETVAAGREFRSATTLLPGAGPASPDIASSGVSEGGTALSLREEKWAGMKKLCFVDFVEGFLEFIPLFSEVGVEFVALPLTLPLRTGRELRGLSPRLRGAGLCGAEAKARRPISPLRGENSEIEELARSGPNLEISQEGGLGEVGANGTVPLSGKI